MGIIGYGTIGNVVARRLHEGSIPGCELVGVFSRSGTCAAHDVDSVAAVIERADVVVEAAGHAALAEYGPAILDEGRDLLAVSVGALANPVLYETLMKPRHGRLYLSSGAIGGLDLLRAGMLGHRYDHVSLTSVKPSSALVQEWMPVDLRTALEQELTPVVAFDGTARRAAALFPASANVAATLALATVGFDSTRVRLIGDPQVDGIEHRIEASGEAGTWSFQIRNRPTPDNPLTSQITPYAVLRALHQIVAETVVGF